MKTIEELREFLKRQPSEEIRENLYKAQEHLSRAEELSEKLGEPFVFEFADLPPRKYQPQNLSKEWKEFISSFHELRTESDENWDELYELQDAYLGYNGKFTQEGDGWEYWRTSSLEC